LCRGALYRNFLAPLGFVFVKAREIPEIVALWRVAPCVRLSAVAIFASVSLRAMLLRTRMSSFDQARLKGAFRLRTTAFAIFAPSRSTRILIPRDARRSRLIAPISPLSVVSVTRRALQMASGGDMFEHRASRLVVHNRLEGKSIFQCFGARRRRRIDFLQRWRIPPERFSKIRRAT
jgi:hypothetical protein